MLFEFPAGVVRSVSTCTLACLPIIQPRAYLNSISLHQHHYMRENIETSVTWSGTEPAVPNFRRGVYRIFFHEKSSQERERRTKFIVIAYCPLLYVVAIAAQSFHISLGALTLNNNSGIISLLRDHRGSTQIPARFKRQGVWKHSVLLFPQYYTARVVHMWPHQNWDTLARTSFFPLSFQGDLSIFL